MDHLLAHSLHSRLSKTLVRMHVCILTIFLLKFLCRVWIRKEKKSSPLIPSLAPSILSASRSELVVSSCAFHSKSKDLCDILISHKIQGSHSHSHFVKHFTKWLQLHQRSHYFATATTAAVLATVEALPKGPLVSRWRG
jgi:hypothetical protein